MNKIERINQIQKFIEKKEIVKTADINKKFSSVSTMTLNRDLTTLVEMKLIYKISFGYCSKNYFQNNQVDDMENSISAIKEKQIIAKKANDLIEEKEIIYLSPGTTSEFLVKKITKNCILFTNSWKVFTLAKENSKIKPFLIGGEDKHNKNIFTGTETTRSFLDLQFDKAFISTTGITLDGKLLNSNKEEALIETISINNSKESIIIADSSKFFENSKGNYIFSSLEKCNVLITNDLNKAKKNFNNKIKIV